MKCKYYYLLFLFFILKSLDAQNLIPKSKGEVIKHQYYTLSYVEEFEQAEWVHYVLNSSMFLNSLDRTNNFRPDPNVSTGSAQLKDYSGSGYDRGHLAPAGDMKIDRIAMSESFFMSNMSPQSPSFNRGGWKNLETLLRGWAQSQELIITAGGVLTFGLKKIGSNGVAVPNLFYKIVYSPKNNKAISFLMPNDKATFSLDYYTTTIDKIEELTGIDFLSDLDDALEDEIESNSDINGWDFNSKYNLIKPLTSSQVQSERCNGIAKSTGNQCNNKTKNENGYCYVHQSQSSDYKPPQKSDYVGRCNANSKSGTRCKRNASSGRRFCWQH